MIKKTDWQNVAGRIYPSSLMPLFSPKQARQEVDFIIKTFNLKNKSYLLDVMCGNGQRSIELADQGFFITGVESSGTLVKEATKKAKEAKSKIEFLQQDIRQLDLSKRFDMVTMLGNSFGYFDDKGNERVIQNISAVLKKNGLFVLDLPNTIDIWVHIKEKKKVKIPQGYITTENFSFDPKSFRLQSRGTVELNKKRREFSGSIRLYTLPEIAFIMAQYQLSIKSVFGSYKGELYSITSPRMIVVANKDDQKDSFRYRATVELRAAHKKLKKLDKAKSEFISIASHQLRTPLTVIKGYISMMLEGNFGKLTKKVVSSLEKVYDSNERLIRLVENLLNISRIESGRLQLNFEIIQFEYLVSDVLEELSGNAKKKGLLLSYKLPRKPLPKVKVDEEKIRQVVMNLIDNAIKYTDKDRVTVSLKSLGQNIEFCISDNGIGIKKEDLPNLFKKFFRGSNTPLVHTEGIGLGLYVARQMIEAHGGRIWAESQGQEKGSRFCFLLPVVKEDK